MEVAYVPEAEEELARLPPHEQAAMLNVIEKLREFGSQLPPPHSSAVKTTKLRELRPRSGRSPWRAFYRRVGDVMLIGAIGPEAKQDSRGFVRATGLAEQRIRRVEQEQDNGRQSND
jgi:hypothetical protein